MKAMILAAGRGTRLGKITESVPKALVDINGKSILRIAVEKCTAAGFGEIIVNIHHHAGMVEKEIHRLVSEGFSIEISDEREMLLETGGGLYRARNFFDNEPFLLYNADIITDLDIKKLYNYHVRKKGLATLAVRNRPGNRFFLVNSDGLLRGWLNKATHEKIIAGEREEELTEIAFSGLHIIDPEIFNYMNDGIYTMTALYLQLAASNKIYTFCHNDGFWGDIGTPENLEKIRASRTIL
jgi:NDP-sugar pyrophosphorylase family protein